MNKMKFRPIGRPSAPTVSFPLTQTKAVMQQTRGKRLPSRSQLIRLAYRQGFVPARRG